MNIKIEDIKVTFGNRKGTAYTATFFGFLRPTEYRNTDFRQHGTFRSEHEFIPYDSKGKFISAVRKYLRNPNAVIERLEIDGADCMKGNNESEIVCILEMALNTISNQNN